MKPFVIYDYDRADDPVGDAYYEIFAVATGRVVDFADSVEHALKIIKRLEGEA